MEPRKDKKKTPNGRRAMHSIGRLKNLIMAKTQIGISQEGKSKLHRYSLQEESTGDQSSDSVPSIGKGQATVRSATILQSGSCGERDGCGPGRRRGYDDNGGLGQQLSVGGQGSREG